MNGMPWSSWAVSITVYEFQVVLNTHAVNNILLVSGMLLNCIQRSPFLLHLTGLEIPGNSYWNYPQSHAKIHLTLRTLKNSNQNIFSKFFSRSQHEWGKCHEWEVPWVGKAVGVCVVNLVGRDKVTRFRDSLPWAVPGPRQLVSSTALLCVWFSWPIISRKLRQSKGPMYHSVTSIWFVCCLLSLWDTKMIDAV